jgi:histidinol-phosphate aminotransferase
MTVSRRKFFRTLGLGAAVGAAAQVPLGLAFGSPFEPARTREPGGPVLLNNNENVYGPSSKVDATIRAAIPSVNRYPFNEYDVLTERIAALHKVKPEQVILGCGSTEVLQASVQAFLGSGKRLVQASPTYEAPFFAARSVGAEVVSIPLNKEFAHDLDGMLAQVNDSTTLVYICNPNNPTASLTQREGLENFIARLPAKCYVLIDEAYHHYVGQSSMYKSFLDYPLQDDRVIVARTFSKIFALAGLRIGYGIASPELAKRINTYVTDGGISIVGLKAAIASLDDVQGMAMAVKRNADTRQEFFNQAMARMLKPIDSHTNFIMMDTQHPIEPTIEHFKKQNILIGRRFPAMNTYARISLGTTDDMKAFWRGWDTLPFAKMPMMH